MQTKASLKLLSEFLSFLFYTRFYTYLKCSEFLVKHYLN